MLAIDNRITLDYISFSLSRSEESMDKVEKLAEKYDINRVDYGGMGYDRSAYIFDGGRVFWHSEREEMGIHVRLNSASLGLVDYTALGLINLVIGWGAKITRLDLAFDDMSAGLSIEEMYRKLLLGEVVTRFRRVARIEGTNLSDGEKTGHTVNVGSRQSEAFVRIYDKKAERIARKATVPAAIKNWVRVELELKSDKANEFAKVLAETANSFAGNAGEKCSGLLLGLLDFKEVSGADTNKSRWKTCDWWLDFVGSVQKVRLSIPTKVKTLEQSKDWLSSQVATTMAMIVLSRCDDNGNSGFDFIVKCIQDGEARMSKAQQMRLNIYNREKAHEKQTE